MIRINLLSEGRRPVVARSAKPKVSFGSMDPSAVILLAGLIVGLVVAGGWFYKLNSELKSWQQRVLSAQKELKELDEYVKKVEKFKKKQAELNTKIEIIKGLTASQSGPVHVMDEVSKAMPELLWLTSMDMKGERVKLSGMAFNTNAVAQLIENLVAVTWFSEPESGPISRQGKDLGLYKFDLSFGFSTAKLVALTQGTEPSAEQPADGEGGGEG